MTDRQALEQIVSWIDANGQHAGSCDRADPSCSCGITQARNEAVKALAALPAPADGDREGAATEGVVREEQCQRCKRDNPIVWHAASPLWNAVMRSGDTGREPHHGIICPTCFIEIASTKGFSGFWRLKLLDVDLQSIWVDGDGRVWDDEAYLWVEPSQSADGDRGNAAIAREIADHAPEDGRLRTASAITAALDAKDRERGEPVAWRVVKVDGTQKHFWRGGPMLFLGHEEAKRYAFGGDYTIPLYADTHGARGSAGQGESDAQP